MSLSIGIVGLPNVGKSTLFNALTKNNVLAANYPFATIEPNVGVVGVPDERLAKLAQIFGSEKILPAALSFVDIAGIVKGASEGAGLGNYLFDRFRGSSKSEQKTPLKSITIHSELAKKSDVKDAIHKAEIIATYTHLVRDLINTPPSHLTPETFCDAITQAVKKAGGASAVGRDLNDNEYVGLYDLEQLMLDRKVAMSGRTLWLGGTDVAKTREASQFNCSFTQVETVYDVVDCLWLLLQGCGVGFKPIVGTLNGFSKPIKDIRVVRSTRTSKGGREHNVETWDADTKTWTISVGDSAEAWAKSIGKLIAGKYPADTLVLDFSQLRPAGERLKGYGWISSGDRDRKSVV